MNAHVSILALKEKEENNPIWKREKKFQKSLQRVSLILWETQEEGDESGE